MLVSTYTLRPIVSALTIFQHWELNLISSRLLHPNINCGGEEAGETRRTEEMRRMTGDGKQVGSYSTNFAKWFDTTIVFSNEQSLGFSTDNHHLSCSRFLKMHKCTCFTFYAAQWMGLQCWPGDLMSSFHCCLLSRRAEEAPHSPSTFCLRLLSDGIGPFCHYYSRLGRNKNAANLSICHLPRRREPWHPLLVFLSNSIWLRIYHYLTMSLHTLRTVHS